MAVTSQNGDFTPVQRLTPSGEGRFTTKKINMNAGQTNLQWKAVVPSFANSYDKAAAIIIRSIEVKGLPYTTDCSKCPDGTYSSVEAQMCTACEPNTYSKSGAHMCSPCNSQTEYSGLSAYNLSKIRADKNSTFRCLFVFILL